MGVQRVECSVYVSATTCSTFDTVNCLTPAVSHKHCIDTLIIPQHNGHSQEAAHVQQALNFRHNAGRHEGLYSQCKRLRRSAIHGLQ